MVGSDYVNVFAFEEKKSNQQIDDVNHKKQSGNIKPSLALGERQRYGN